jgi:hypothetical protein
MRHRKGGGKAAKNGKNRDKIGEKTSIQTECGVLNWLQTKTNKNNQKS